MINLLHNSNRKFKKIVTVVLFGLQLVYCSEPGSINLPAGDAIKKNIGIKPVDSKTVLPGSTLGDLANNNTKDEIESVKRKGLKRQRNVDSDDESGFNGPIKRPELKRQQGVDYSEDEFKVPHSPAKRAKRKNV